MQLLRKISRATVIGSNVAVMEKALAEKDKVHTLYNVYGYATGTRKSSDNEKEDGDSRAEQYGPWECLIGAFQAENMLTGEVYRSGQCFLPQFAIDMVAGQLGGDVERVKFGFRVGAKFDEASATKYTYVVEPLLEPEENDPMALLANEIKAVPQITGPKKAGK